MQVWYLSTIACPLLEDNRCVAYRSRPLICRLTLSRKDPALCHPHQYDGRYALPQEDFSVELKAFRELEAQVHVQQGIRITLSGLSQSLLVAEKLQTGVIDLARVDFEQFLLAGGSQ